MGFKKTSEGRVFFKSPDNDDSAPETPLSKALANSEPLVPKDNTQMQILLLLKSLNTKLKSSREDHESLAKDVMAFKETLAKIEKTGPITGNVIETKSFKEAQQKIKALEEKAAKYEKDYIDLEQQVARKQSEVSKKASRVEDHVNKTLEIVETLKETTQEHDETVQKIKSDVEKKIKLDAEIVKKQKELEDKQKEQAEKMVDNVAAYVALTKRVSGAEERHEKLDNKIEEGRADYIKLDRKIDKVIEDRNRILRKVERIEQAVLETRDALNAKAMVLLTDQGAVAGVDMPGITHNGMQTDPLAIQKRIEEEALMPAWRKPLRISAASLAIAAILILLLGYLISASQYGGQALQNNSAPMQTPIVRLSEAQPPPPLEIESPILEQTAQSASVSIVEEPEPLIEPDLATAEVLETYEPAASEAPEKPAQVEPEFNPDFGITIHKGVDDPSKIKQGVKTINVNNPQELEKAFDKDPEAVARALNKIEPSSVTREALPPPIIEQDEPAKSYQTAAYKAGLKSRISPDPNLRDLSKRIETKAFDGIPEAQHDMGAIYVSGHNNVKRDLDRAILWFSEASNNGIANATYNLGVLHHRGLGVPKDVSKAMALYEKAAEQGHPEAQYNLGIANLEGVGMSYDVERAAYYFERAASQGVTEAAYNLGLIYENGVLGQAEPGKALSWYKYAAEQGSPEAKSALNQLASSLNISVDDVNNIVETVRKSSSSQPAANTDLVSKIQTELFELGFYPGTVDGQIGPVTRSAIRAFQRAAELPIDGEPSQNLLTVLKASKY